MDSFDELMRIQRNTATRLRREDELDRKVGLMTLIQGLNPDRRGRILTELIVVEALAQGYNEEDTNRFLDELEEDGYIKRVDDGIMVLV